MLATLLTSLDEYLPLVTFLHLMISLTIFDSLKAFDSINSENKDSTSHMLTVLKVMAFVPGINLFMILLLVMEGV